MDVAILGAGAWGTALATVLAQPTRRVWLHSWRAQHAQELEAERINHVLLPGVRLPDQVSVTHDYKTALRHTRWVVLAVPTQALRSTLELAKPALSPEARLISVCKGIENHSRLLVHQVILDVLGEEFEKPTVHLSGPSFAREVAARVPTNLVAAARDVADAEAAQALVATERLRVYTSADPIGVQIGGALKNVVAIAAGACAGLGFGYNAQAALITRGLSEMTRFSEALGGHAQTLAGLSGLGDLILSASYELSRNRQLGFRIGAGDAPGQALGKLGGVAEGHATARAAFELAQEHALDVPICNNVYQVLYESKPVADAVSELLQRPLKREWA